MIQGSSQPAVHNQLGETTMKTGIQLQQDMIAELKWEPSVKNPERQGAEKPLC